METAASLNQVSVRYGSYKALNNVTFTIRAEQITGLIGPNGAGKSTTIRTLLGQTFPSDGTVTCFDKALNKTPDRSRNQMGYLPGDARFPGGLTGWQYLDHCARFYTVRDSEEIKRLAAGWQLDLSRKIRGYSTGMQRQLGFLQAIQHQPGFLILDEPERGLDPLSRFWLYDAIRSQKNKGTAVLLASHNLFELEELADHIVVLKNGQVVADAPTTSLKPLTQTFKDLFDDRLPQHI